MVAGEPGVIGPRVVPHAERMVSKQDPEPATVLLLSTMERTASEMPSKFKLSKPSLVVS